MKSYTFKLKEIELVKNILLDPPKKIWYDFVWCVFDYGDYHIKLECLDEPADSQNKSDRAIIASINRIEEKFIPSEGTELVCEEEIIQNIFIVRTFLYFTTYRNHTWIEKFCKQSIHKIKSLLNDGEDLLGILLSKTIGGNSEIICNPNSREAKSINPEYANLLDVGLLIKINDKYLRAYLQDNVYGFHFWDGKYFFNEKELTQDYDLYEFIEVEEI